MPTSARNRPTKPRTTSSRSNGKNTRLHRTGQHSIHVPTTGSSSSFPSANTPTTNHSSSSSRKKRSKQLKSSSLAKKRVIKKKKSQASSNRSENGDSPLLTPADSPMGHTAPTGITLSPSTPTSTTPPQKAAVHFSMDDQQRNADSTDTLASRQNLPSTFNVRNFDRPVHNAVCGIMMALSQQQQQSHSSQDEAEENLYEETTAQIRHLLNIVMSDQLATLADASSSDASNMPQGQMPDSVTSEREMALKQELQDVKEDLQEREQASLVLQKELNQTRDEYEEMRIKYNALREENAKNVQFLNVLRGFHENLLNSNQSMFSEVGDMLSSY